MERFSSPLYFKIAETEKELEKCFKLRYQVYCKEKKWLPESEYPDGNEIDNYDLKSIHLMAYDDEFELVGTCRIILAKYCDKMPYLSHPGLKDKGHSYQGEISRLIVIANKNRHNVVRGLLRLIYTNCMNINVYKIGIIVEPSAIRFLKFYHLFFEPIGTPAKYFGNFTLPAMIDLKKNDLLLKRRYPESYKFYKQEYNSISNSIPVYS